MLSGILRSARAVAVNIEIMRAFVALRHLARSSDALTLRMDGIEREMRVRFAEHDEGLAVIIEALDALMAPPVPRRRGVGFAPPADE